MTIVLISVVVVVNVVVVVVVVVSGGGGGGGRCAPCHVACRCACSPQGISEVLPVVLRKSEAGRTTFQVRANGLLDSLATVLQQEMVKFNRLLNRVTSSLANLARAIQGLVVMSAELDKMYTAMLNNQVPSLWAAVAYPSLKPLASWVKDLTSRVQFMRRWLTHGQPKAFPLPVFFFPQGFMTGALQVHSRKTKIAVDTLVFRTAVRDFSEDECKEGPENGVYVYGAFLEGARWDRERHVVTEMVPGTLFSYLPVIWLDPLIKSEYNPQSVYRCPFYKTSRRAGTLSTTGHSTNFIVKLDLPSEHDEDHWIRRGVALLSMLVGSLALFFQKVSATIVGSVCRR